MEPIDLRALEEAVIVFYRSGASQQAAAHEWLTKAQSSQQAWSFVWDLMQMNKVYKSTVFHRCNLNHNIRLLWRTVIGSAIFWCHHLTQKAGKKLE